MLEAARLVAAVRAGTETAEGVVERCAARIEEREREIRAFSWLTVGDALRRARELERSALPLAGLPFGVKDIIDTAGVPTECGSPLFAGRVPAASAAIVDRIIRLGGVMLGKTVTAELAFATPGPTRNPWNVARTPGGSSMGSAAGVAAGMVPLALGTQTNSSLIMPAALCGVVGFKPSAGALGTDGVMAFSPTLDQLGWITATATDAALVAELLLGVEVPIRRSLRLAVLRTAEWEGTSQSVRVRFDAALAALRGAGLEVVDEPGPPAALAGARPVHRTIMAYEAVRSVGPAVASRPEVVSAVLRRFLAEGEGIGPDAYAAALGNRAELTEACSGWLDGFDAVVTPAAPTEAPSADGTGDARFCTAWTLIGAPAVVLPSGRGAEGLPVGLQLVGAPGADTALLGTARAVEPLLA
jgi:Asp-tRNA(Asn)/Glu-tRNA(Gln) amidotransferase A subunit family amidase